MSPNRKALIAVVAIAAVSMIGSGAFLYVKRSSTDSEIPAAASAAPAAVIPPPSGPSRQMSGKASLTMQEAADRLSLRLRMQGGNADDWALLARSYVELRQYSEAVSAFEQALKKSPNDAQLRKDAESARQAAKRT